MHDGSNCHRRHLVDEHSRTRLGVDFRDGVHNFATEGADCVLVDRSSRQLAVLDDDIVASRRPELQREVLREQLREDGPSFPDCAGCVFTVGGGQLVDGRLSEKVQRLCFGELGIVVSQQIQRRDVVLDGADDVLAEPWRENLLLHSHQHARFRSGFLVLQRVHIHLVAVKVGVIRRTDGRVEPERLVRHHDDFVSHNRHPVQRGLAVEHHNISVDQVTIDFPAGSHFFGEFFTVFLRHLQSATVRSANVVRARVSVGAVPHVPARVVDVPLSDVHCLRHLGGDAVRDADLVQAECRIRRDDRPCREVDPFPGQRATEPAFLAFEAL